MSYQRIISKSPLRTQSHSIAMFHPDHHRQMSNQFTQQQRSKHPTIQQDELLQLKQKCYEQQKTIENQHLQMNEMRQFISDCQFSLSHFKQQLEYQQSLQEQHNTELQELQELVNNLKDENQELTLLYNEKQKELQDLKNDDNKQMDGAMKARIENDIKDIHNKYLREIQMLKVKIHDQDQHQQVISQLQEKCEELLQGIETKNNYIDNLLLQLSELDEKYESLKKKFKH